MKTNDLKIEELKKLIEEKKKLIIKKRFAPITSCSIVINGERKNIHALDIQNLKHMLVSLNCFRLSAVDLKMDSYKLDNFEVTEWISDINQKIKILESAEEEKKLAELENKLNILLSNDKKTELQIKEIERLIG